MQRALIMVALVLIVVTAGVSRVKEQRLQSELDAAQSQLAFLERQVTVLQTEKSRLEDVSKSAVVENEALSVLVKQQAAEVPDSQAVQLKLEAAQKKAEGMAAELMRLRNLCPVEAPAEPPPAEPLPDA